METKEGKALRKMMDAARLIDEALELLDKNSIAQKPLTEAYGTICFVINLAADND